MADMKEHDQDWRQKDAENFKVNFAMISVIAI